MKFYAMFPLTVAVVSTFAVGAPQAQTSTGSTGIAVTQADSSGLSEIEKKKARRAAAKEKRAKARAKRKAARVNSQSEDDRIFLGGS